MSDTGGLSSEPGRRSLTKIIELNLELPSYDEKYISPKGLCVLIDFNIKLLKYFPKKREETEKERERPCERTRVGEREWFITKRMGNKLQTLAIVSSNYGSQGTMFS